PATAPDIARVEIGPATEGATILGTRAVKPERQGNGVTKQEINIAALQRQPRLIGVRIGPQLSLRKQDLQVGLMRGAGHHGYCAALELLRNDLLDGRIAARYEAG